MPISPAFAELLNKYGGGLIHMEIFVVKGFFMPGSTLLELIATNILLRGTHALRPPVGDVPIGTEYYSSDTLKRWKSDGTTWLADGEPGGATPPDPLTLAALILTTRVVSPVTELTMTGTLTLNAVTSTTYWHLNPNGSDRQVDLPPEALGLTYSFKHVGGANTITIKNDATGTETTLTPSQFKTLISGTSAWQVY